jgi:hypothetical protein
MLQYDLTGTSFFEATSRDDLPTEAEMFVVTVALLMYHDVAYSSLAGHAISFQEVDLAGVAECIEYRLPFFASDLVRGRGLRERLRDFVGLRIGYEAARTRATSGHPT